METEAQKAARVAVDTAMVAFRDAKAIEAEARKKREAAWKAVVAATKALAKTA